MCHTGVNRRNSWGYLSGKSAGHCIALTLIVFFDPAERYALACSRWTHARATRLINFQIITNVFVQTVILLYLIDNNTDTSWMILLGSGMGVVIEAWKASHVMQTIIALMLTPRVRSQKRLISISTFSAMLRRGHRSKRAENAEGIYVAD
ncbi:cleft lip and palate transmembrane protein 1-domain-containing protein [Lanmaoa asiatica]|nr:cleft lip and palate transmembrane protein 1-domain-containing protein [Lanmaoa asiatica]